MLSGAAVKLEACPDPRRVLVLWSVTLCLIFFVAAPKGMKSTVSNDYEPQVLNLLAGRGFVDENGMLMCRYPPAYPLVLASMRMMQERTRIPLSWLMLGLSAGCIAGATLLVHAIAQVVLPGRGSLTAGLLFAAHPHVLYGVLIPMSETPFAVALLSAVFCLVAGLKRRPVWGIVGYFLAGVLCGIAVLFRPAGLLTPLVMAAGCVVVHSGRIVSRLLCAVTLLIGALLAVMPWQSSILRRSERVVLISSAGAPALRDGLSFNHKSMRRAIWLPEGVRWLSDEAWQSYGALDSTSAILSFLKDRAVERPAAVAQTYLFKAARSWYGTDSQHGWVELFNAFVTLLFGIPAVIGARRYFGGGLARSGCGAILLALVFCYWGIASIVLSIARYMTPAVGLLAPFTALGLIGGESQRRVHSSTSEAAVL